MLKLTKRDRACLRKLCGFKCKHCGYPEDKVGMLQPHRRNQNKGYELYNIDMLCAECHEIISSAQRIAGGQQ